MKLKCVLTAVNENPLYLDFIPYFIKCWNRLYPNIDVKVIIVSTTLPIEFKDYHNNIIHFKPKDDNISTAFISQYIRLLYPAILDYNGGVLITDIDMIPMNMTYYSKNIESFTNSNFISYRHFNDNCTQIPMCYNIANPVVWSNIFNIDTISDIHQRIEVVYNRIDYQQESNNHWYTDQLDLYKYINNWSGKDQYYICLEDNITAFKRLGRNRDFNIEQIREQITNGLFTDYHCLRPQSKYSEINEKIYKLLPLSKTINK